MNTLSRAVLALAVCLAASGADATGASLRDSNTVQTQIPVGGLAIELRPVIPGGLSSVLIGNTQNARPQLVPIDMTPLGDGRQLVFTVSGHVRLIRQDGVLSAGAYLDTRDPSRAPAEFNFIELGNTSIAAHPGFSDPVSRGFGKFYTLNAELVQFQLPSDFDDGVSSQVDSVLYEWSIDDPAQNLLGTSFRFLGPNPNITRREILRSRRPGIIHTLADIAFTPDEYLIITSGDGGGNAVPPGSSSVQSRERNALNPRSIFGSLLRIDPLDLAGVDSRPQGANGQYRIHPNNLGVVDADPLTPGETLAYGLRSPYRVSVDPVTGTVFFGDVGEGNREEINSLEVDASGTPLESGNSGVNFGWGRFEGTRFHSNISNTIGGRPFVSPLFELFHNLGAGAGGQSEATTVVGGFVYRGTAFPELVGKYVFADTGEDEMQQPTNELDLYYGDPRSATLDGRDDLSRVQLTAPPGVSLPDRIWSLAEGEDGELYALVGPRRGNDFSNPFGDDPNGTDGGVYQLVPTCASGVGGSDCASVTDLGGGCVNSSGARATLSSPVDALPILGANWSLQLQSAPVGASAFVTLGLTSVGGLDLGLLMAPGCVLHSDLSLAIPVVVDPLGSASIAVAISSALPVGFPVVGQAAILDPGINPLGLALSDAVAASLGVR